MSYSHTCSGVLFLPLRGCPAHPPSAVRPHHPALFCAGGQNLGSFATLVQSSGKHSSFGGVIPLPAWIAVFSAVGMLLAQVGRGGGGWLHVF